MDKIREGDRIAFPDGRRGHSPLLPVVRVTAEHVNNPGIPGQFAVTRDQGFLGFVVPGGDVLPLHDILPELEYIHTHENAVFESDTDCIFEQLVGSGALGKEWERRAD